MSYKWIPEASGGFVFVYRISLNRWIVVVTPDTRECYQQWGPEMETASTSGRMLSYTLSMGRSHSHAT